jgi:hypothetical protein
MAEECIVVSDYFFFTFSHNKSKKRSNVKTIFLHPIYHKSDMFWFIIDYPQGLIDHQ